jgi:nucleotide-binding universal stress UspA family protein
MNMPILVVGIDGSPASHTALRYALDEARTQGYRVQALTCWSRATKAKTGPGLPGADSHDHASRIQRKTIFEVAHNAQEIRQVECQIEEGEAGPLLVAAADKAAKLIVGTSNKGTIARISGHDVDEYCLRHAKVPVVVVPWTPEGLDEREIEADLRHGEDRSNSSSA